MNERLPILCGRGQDRKESIAPLLLSGLISDRGRSSLHRSRTRGSQTADAPKAEAGALLRLPLDSWVSPRRSRLSKVVTRPTVSGDTSLLFGTQDTAAASMQESSPR